MDKYLQWLSSEQANYIRMINLPKGEISNSKRKECRHKANVLKEAMSMYRTLSPPPESQHPLQDLADNMIDEPDEISDKVTRNMGELMQESQQDETCPGCFGPCGVCEQDSQQGECVVCGGHGRRMYGGDDCPQCNGTGREGS